MTRYVQGPFGYRYLSYNTFDLSNEEIRELLESVRKTNLAYEEAERNNKPVFKPCEYCNPSAKVGSPRISCQRRDGCSGWLKIDGSEDDEKTEWAKFLEAIANSTENGER